MGVVEVAALRPCPVPASSSFPPCVRVRAFTDTLLLYNYTLRRAISYKLAYIRARAPLRYSRIRSRARTRAAFTCGGDEFRSNFNNTAIEWR